MIYQHRKPNLWKGILLLIGFAAMIMMYFVSCKSAPPADPCKHTKQNMQISVLQRALNASSDTIGNLRTDIDTLDFMIDSLDVILDNKDSLLAARECVIKVTGPNDECEYRVYFPDSIKLGYVYKLDTNGVLTFKCQEY